MSASFPPCHCMVCVFYALAALKSLLRFLFIQNLRSLRTTKGARAYSVVLSRSRHWMLAGAIWCRMTVHSRQRVWRAVVVVPWCVRACLHLCFSHVCSEYCCVQKVFTPYSALGLCTGLTPSTTGHCHRHNLLSTLGALAVLGALRYKPEGRGFDSQWCH